MARPGQLLESLLTYCMQIGSRFPHGAAFGKAPCVFFLTSTRGTLRLPVVVKIKRLAAFALCSVMHAFLLYEQTLLAPVICYRDSTVLIGGLQVLKSAELLRQQNMAFPPGYSVEHHIINGVSLPS
jgi:hypothetical protein